MKKLMVVAGLLSALLLGACGDSSNTKTGNVEDMSEVKVAYPGDYVTNNITYNTMFGGFKNETTMLFYIYAGNNSYNQLYVSTETSDLVKNPIVAVSDKQIVRVLLMDAKSGRIEYVLEERPEEVPLSSYPTVNYDMEKNEEE